MKDSLCLLFFAVVQFFCWNTQAAGLIAQQDGASANYFGVKYRNLLQESAKIPGNFYDYYKKNSLHYATDFDLFLEGFRAGFGFLLNYIQKDYQFQQNVKNAPIIFSTLASEVYKKTLGLGDFSETPHNVVEKYFESAALFLQSEEFDDLFSTQFCAPSTRTSFPNEFFESFFSKFLSAVHRSAMNPKTCSRKTQSSYLYAGPFSWKTFENSKPFYFFYHEQNIERRKKIRELFEILSDCIDSICQKVEKCNPGCLWTAYAILGFPMSCFQEKEQIIENLLSTIFYWQDRTSQKNDIVESLVTLYSFNVDERNLINFLFVDKLWIDTFFQEETCKILLYERFFVPIFRRISFYWGLDKNDLPQRVHALFLSSESACSDEQDLELQPCGLQEIMSDLRHGLC